MDLVKDKLLMTAIISLIVVLSIIVIIFAYNRPATDDANTTPTPTTANSVSINPSNIDQLVDIPRNAEITLQQQDLILERNIDSSFDIIIDTNKYNIVGVDVIIEYDSNLVQITELVESGEFDMYPGKKITSDQIMFSGLYNIGTSKSGILNLGSVYFKTLATGEAEFKVKFTPLQTIESNVVENKNSQDVLGKVNNLIFTIK